MELRSVMLTGNVYHSTDSESEYNRAKRIWTDNVWVYIDDVHHGISMYPLSQVLNATPVEYIFKGKVYEAEVYNE